MQRRQWFAEGLQNGLGPVCSGARRILSPLRTTGLRGTWCQGVWMMIFLACHKGR